LLRLLLSREGVFFFESRFLETGKKEQGHTVQKEAYCFHREEENDKASESSKTTKTTVWYPPKMHAAPLAAVVVAIRLSSSEISTLSILFTLATPVPASTPAVVAGDWNNPASHTIPSCRSLAA